MKAVQVVGFGGPERLEVVTQLARQLTRVQQRARTLERRLQAD